MLGIMRERIEIVIIGLFSSKVEKGFSLLIYSILQKVKKLINHTRKYSMKRLYQLRNKELNMS